MTDTETAIAIPKDLSPARLRAWLSDGAVLGLDDPPRWSGLGIFLAADLALIATHVANAVTANHSFLLINHEFGLGELFQYGKFLTIALTMALLAQRSRSAGPALWGLIFLYLAIDDAFAIHEALGRALARQWGLAEGATVSQVGAGVALGLAIVALAGAAHALGGLRRRTTAVLVIGLIGLGFFGVGVDAVHSLDAVGDNRWLNNAVRVVEEGGEMIVASFLVAFALIVRADGRAQTGTGPTERPSSAPG